MKLKDNLFFSNLPIFYINLDKDKKRNEHMIESFKKNNIDLYFRVSAVDVSKLEKSYDEYSLSQPEAALFFSFKKALQMFLDTDYEYAAIAEDDVDLDNSLKINFNFYETLKYHNPEYYVLQCAPTLQREESTSLKIVKRDPKPSEPLWGTPIMIINRAFAERIMNEVFYDNDIHPCGPEDYKKQLDYCIYLHAEAYVWTTFTVKDFDSTISPDKDKSIITKSISIINLFMQNKEVFLEDIF